ncbi:MAG: alpha/beta fold hydrolase [Bacteroidetes bacterium]|nr:alpha/beta fold hydrolase [Bacteroidota bacterium]
MNSKIVIISLIFLSSFIFNSCSDNTVTSGNPENLTASYECPVSSTTALTHFFSVNLKHSGSTLSGDVQSYDSSDTHKGVLTGTFDGASVSVTGDITGTNYDFTFTGSLISTSPKKISGNLVFSTGDAEPIPVEFVETVAVDTSIPPNPYMFESVFTTPNPTGPPVIFVHGMGGTIREWDSAMASLPADFKLRHNVYRYQYDWQKHIEVNGIVLRDSVLARGLVNPIIVGHSMGGLVCRAYVKNGGAITKLVTFGTPHYGSPLAKLKNFVPWLGLDGPQDIVPNSPFLTALNNDPVDIANRSKYYLLAGRMGGSISGVKWVWKESYYSQFVKIAYYVMKLYYPNKDNDGLVSEDSALLTGGGANNPLPVQLWVDHMHEQYPIISSGMYNYVIGL